MSGPAAEKPGQAWALPGLLGFYNPLALNYQLQAPAVSWIIVGSKPDWQIESTLTMDSIQKPGLIDFKQLYCSEVQGWQEEDFRPEGPGLARLFSDWARPVLK